MEYLKLFENHSLYEDFIKTEDFVLPNVSHCIELNEVHYNPIPDPYNGHAYVDLGLPSGTKWATMNVGATNITDHGYFYRYGKGAEQYASPQVNYRGTETPLALEVDTAACVWGGDWHMPTKALMQELVGNTTYQFVVDYNSSGVDGGLFTAQNGNSIFIPAPGYKSNNSMIQVGYGYIWSSWPYDNEKAYDLYFYDGYIKVSRSYREAGYSVRPVVG